MRTTERDHQGLPLANLAAKELVAKVSATTSRKMVSAHAETVAGIRTTLTSRPRTRSKRKQHQELRSLLPRPPLRLNKAQVQSTLTPKVRGKAPVLKEAARARVRTTATRRRLFVVKSKEVEPAVTEMIASSLMTSRPSMTTARRGKPGVVRTRLPPRRQRTMMTEKGQSV